MAKASSDRIKHSAFSKGKKAGNQLDHWFGPHQHVGTGIATDPNRKAVDVGVLYSEQKRQDD